MDCQQKTKFAARDITPAQAQGWPSLGLGDATIRARRFVAPRGFTLVELLVTISILAIMASLLLFALYGAQEQARIQKTRATIAKLHNLVMQRLESYPTRRVPIISAPGLAPTLAAKRRLDALRELMRLEMPDRYSDIIDDPITPAQVDATGAAVGSTKMARSSVSQAYLRKVLSTPGYTGTYAGAECFYLFVTMGLESEESDRQLFGASETGDVDNDGMSEFLDAWGRPIRWLRWAPGFISELQTGDPVKQPDPFDPRHVYPNATQPQVTFALTPLIYSAGPDGQYDIVSDLSPVLQYSTINNNPFNSNSIGQQTDTGQEGQSANSENEWFDNIHNHLIGLK